MKINDTESRLAVLRVQDELLFCSTDHLLCRHSDIIRAEETSGLVV